MNGIGRATGLTAAALAVAGLAVGCGGSSGGDAGAATADDRRAQFREAAVEYSRCMRENGIDMPDPEPGQGGGIVMRAGPGTPGRDDPAFQEAEAKCREKLEDVRPPQISEEEQAELRDAMLEFARCMRENGVDMPDPQFDGGRVRMRIGPGDGGRIDPADPAFQQAREECQDALPDRGPGAPPAP